MLTVADVERRLEEIQGVTYDDERAHGMEDALRAEVLRDIAAGAPDAPALAAKALESGNIVFERWGA